MQTYLERDNANLGGAFRASRASDGVIEAGREAIADFVGGHPDEIAFGANMTTLNFLLAHAVARTLEPGDEIVTTWLDHDANVSPWLLVAQDRGLVVRQLDVVEPDLDLDLDALEGLVNERTRIVAFTLASNAVGTIPDARRVAEIAHRVGALAWADAVHYAPHRRIDVATLGRRRAAVLAVQVLRAASRLRLGAPRAAGGLARRSRATGRGAPAGTPLRDGDAEPRGDRRCDRRRRLPRIARRGSRPARAARRRLRADQSLRGGSVRPRADPPLGDPRATGLRRRGSRPPSGVARRRSASRSRGTRRGRWPRRWVPSRSRAGTATTTRCRSCSGSGSRSTAAGSASGSCTTRPGKRSIGHSTSSSVWPAADRYDPGHRADVAELVDAHGSGPCGRKLVEVQVLSSALLMDRRVAALRVIGGPLSFSGLWSHRGHKQAESE